MARHDVHPRKRIVPGGAAGLQIRGGPTAGSRWVRLPLSSAIPARPRMSSADFLAELEAEARAAAAAETAYRSEAKRRIEELERARAFAFRRHGVLADMAIA